MRDTPTLDLMLALAALLFSIMAVAVAVTGARAHSFYPAECCSDRDCWPMGDASDAREPEPKATSKGWQLSDGSTVAYAAARPSPDGRFHVCRQSGVLNGSVIRPEGRPVCLFAPQPSF